MCPSCWEFCTTKKEGEVILPLSAYTTSVLFFSNFIWNSFLGDGGRWGVFVQESAVLVLQYLETSWYILNHCLLLHSWRIIITQFLWFLVFVLELLYTCFKNKLWPKWVWKEICQKHVCKKSYRSCFVWVGIYLKCYSDEWKLITEFIMKHITWIVCLQGFSISFLSKTQPAFIEWWVRTCFLNFTLDA